jgi:peroxiredoxin
MATAKGRTSKASRTPVLEVGDTAPDFELKTHTGNLFRLSDLRGKKHAVLAFYPFAFSPT